VARKGSAKREEAVPPTAEQQAHGTYEMGDVIDREGAKALRVGKAYRKVRMIELLHRRGLFTDEEAKALKHYRHHADMADRSPVRDSLCVQRFGGNGTGPTVGMLTAIRVRESCERAAMSVQDILRSVVVYDTTLSQWAMARGGAISDCRTVKGVRVCSLRPTARALENAQLEIKIAAQRVQSELDA
jgi:hypothetical protein